KCPRLINRTVLVAKCQSLVDRAHVTLSESSGNSSRFGIAWEGEVFRPRGLTRTHVYRGGALGQQGQLLFGIDNHVAIEPQFRDYPAHFPYGKWKLKFQFFQFARKCGCIQEWARSRGSASVFRLM